MPDLKVDGLIDPSLPALRSLRRLDISRSKISDFPPVVASNLKQLTFLDLSYNQIARIPAALTAITTLQSVSFYGNLALQLMEDDLATLQAMPCLRELRLGARDEAFGEPAYSSKSKAVFQVAAGFLPDLHIDTEGDYFSAMFPGLPPLHTLG